MKQNETVRRKVTLTGITPMLFDKNWGETKVEEWQKFYFGEDGKTIGVPSENILSFLYSSSHGIMSRIHGKKGSTISRAVVSYVRIYPDFVPLERDGQAITFGKFNGQGVDETSRSCIFTCSVPVKKSGKVAARPIVSRPKLPLPWSLSFDCELLQNDALSEQMLLDGYRKGGVELGLCAWPGRYGLFEVKDWV